MERNSLQRWEKEYNFIKGYATKYKMRNTLIALTVALKYHTGQYRDAGEPYIIHPLMVCKTLMLLNIEKAIHKWYGSMELYKIEYECDTMFAAAILHDVIEDCNVSQKELIENYLLDKEVVKVVKALTKLPKKRKFPWDKMYNPDEYFNNISHNWKATLIKIADRANNCSTMQVFKEERMRKYILETQRYIYPLCSEGKRRYPEFSNTITIMKNLIVSTCETIASLIGMQDVIMEESEEYKKIVHFIEGLSRHEMPNTYKALFIAQKFHNEQMRTSGDPFVIHPLRVCLYLISLEIDDDVTYATALLHEIPQRCILSEDWKKILKDYGIIPEVLEAVEIVANKNKPLKEYYQAIERNPVALLEKLSNRVHTCTFLAGVDRENILEYINETKNYMAPICKEGMLKYPQYANQIEIMQSHILSICNVVEVITKKRDNPKETT